MDFFQKHFGFSLTKKITGMGRCDLEQPKISIGARVVRGKDWKWEEQDGNRAGTVTFDQFLFTARVGSSEMGL